MPRLFTALEIPHNVAEALTTLRGGLSGARWIDRENYHVTLRFVGDVSHRDARAFAEELDEIEMAPFEVEIGRLDVFGGNKPRSIIAQVTPSPALKHLQAEHERAARRCGLAAEPRRFTPHVTLARLRDASPLAVADYLSTRAVGRPLRFTAERFVLMSSRDSVGGGPYLVEAAYPPTATAAPAWSALA